MIDACVRACSRRKWCFVAILSMLGLSSCDQLGTCCCRGVSQPSDCANAQAAETEQQLVIRCPTVDSVVSLVELLANPRKYHGRTVSIGGYFIDEFEDTAIYLDRDSAEFGIAANAVWVDTSTGAKKEEYGNYSDKYVVIEARFTMLELGHGGLFQGELKDIRNIRVLERRRRRKPPERNSEAK